MAFWGPISQTHYNDVNWSGSYYTHKERYGQTKPHVLSLPYVREEYRTLEAEAIPPYDRYGTTWAKASVTATGNPVGPYHFDDYWYERDQSRNIAISKYRAMMGEMAQLSVDIIQRQKAFDMISHRAGGLLRLAVSIARRDARGIKRVLRQQLPALPQKGIRRVSRDFGSAWLEYIYGWAPMIQDIGVSVELLQGRVPPLRCEGNGPRLPYEYLYRGKTTSTSGSYVDSKGSVCVLVGAEVLVGNPNVNLARNLGFTNPASVLWELVPFSFVVDWFLPVQSFLENFDSSFGYEIQKKWTSTSYRGTSTSVNWNNSLSPAFYRKSVKSGWKFERANSIADVAFVWKPTKRLSPTRAANAISLLTQFLSSKK